MGGMTWWPARIPWPRTGSPTCWSQRWVWPFSPPPPPAPSRGGPAGRLRLDAMVDRELLRRCRARLRFARKVSSALTGEAVESLAQAKAMHDGLEALYNPYVDFDRGQEMADRIAEELLALD
ncbi:MAG: hypothetical protein ACLT3D_12465 [Lawsonibacter sp.]